MAGCDKLSSVGDQDGESAPPFAEIAVLNQPFTTSGEKVRTRVRAGTEVVLSGKDSDSFVFPVVTFQWKVISTGAAGDVQLIPRTRDTVIFRAPMLAQDTSLEFELTVADAKGTTAKRRVEVVVEGVPDSRHFLSYNLDALNTFRLNAITSQNVAAGSLPTDVSFDILVRQLVNYTAPGTGGPFLEVRRQVLQGQWLAASGAGSACQDSRNPGFDVALPAVNIDDIMAVIDTSDPAARPNPAAVDSYELKLEISITPTSGSLPAGVTAQVCAPQVPTPVPVPALSSLQAVALPAAQPHTVASSAGVLQLTLNQLLSLQPSLQDDPASSAAYYATIDPLAQRTTLLDWAKVNGFLSADKQFVKWDELAAGATAQAAYTNNFDLGFGRDMYARLGACDSGYAPPQVGGPIEIAAVGHCDVAAVVINYASLEAAAKKLGPQLVVAMEYSATPATGRRRIVKFYVFALNVYTGSFDRVSSANLDGRGERYVPQVCTVCHGGTPEDTHADGVYAADGDVRATFLPWDLDSFLYSASNHDAEVDRSFTEQALIPQYTRAAQEPSLRRLNQLAYLTFADPDRPQRHTLVRQLVEGWYGADETHAFTSGAYQAFIPPGWTRNGVDGIANTADDNPPDAPAVYENVFARHCRACHIAHEPDAGAGGAHLETFTNASGTFNTCDSRLASDLGGNVIEPASIGVSHQVPMACYRQLLNSKSLAERLSAGVMPFARLSMDRLWTSNDSGASLGEQFLEHLRAQFTASGQTQKAQSLFVPGTAPPQFEISAGDADFADLGAEVLLDGRANMFATRFQWQLDQCQTAFSVVPLCRSQTPSQDTDSVSCVAASEQLRGAAAPLASFTAAQTGIYRATLSTGNAASATAQFLAVPDFKPCLQPSALTNLGSANIGVPVSIGLSSLFSRGNGELAKHVLFVSAAAGGVTPASCAAATGCPADTPVSLAAVVLGANDMQLTLRDQDGEEATLGVRLTGTTSLSAVTVTDVSTTANTPLVVNLRAKNGNPQNVTFEVLAQACPDSVSRTACLYNPENTNAAVNRASVVASANGFTYTPPANFSTHDQGGNAQFDAAAGRFQEVVRYRMRRVSNPNDFSDASVRIPVRATITFATTRNTFKLGPCSTCHLPGGVAPANAHYADKAYDYWRNGDGGGNPNLSNFPHRRVDLTDVENSGFICYPTRDVSRGCTTNHDIDADDYNQDALDRIETLRKWISSGANNY